MDKPLLDLSYLREISDNDPNYMSDVIKIYLDNIPKNLAKLEKLIRNTDDYVAIQREAHSLKSSTSIIKVRDMFDDVNIINIIARENIGNDNPTGKQEIIARLDNALSNLKEALPLIMAERKKLKVKNK